MKKMKRFLSMLLCMMMLLSLLPAGASANGWLTLNVNPVGAGKVKLGNYGYLQESVWQYVNKNSTSISADANDGYEFVNWTDSNGSEVSKNASTTIQVRSDRTLTANFRVKQYTVTANVSSAGGGTATGGGTVNHGQSVTVTATAATGYNFVNWTKGDEVVSTDATCTYTPAESCALTANFEQIKHTISVSANPTAGGNVSGGGEFNDGQSVAVTATAATGYDFVNWTENGAEVSTEATYSFTATTSRALVANFALKQYQVKATSEDPNKGSAEVVGGNATYSHGSEATVKATPNEAAGYIFDVWKWKHNDQIVYEFGGPAAGEEYTFPVYDDYELIAYFKLKQYTVTATDAEGTKEITGVGNYDHGEPATLTAVPKDGYRFVKWVDGETEVTDNPYVITSVTANHTVTPVYELIEYNVTAKAEPAEGGSVSGIEKETYHYGDTINLIATAANEDYIFKNWTKAGAPVSTDASYTFNVTEDCTLVANFAKLHDVKFYKNDGTDEVDTEQVENGNPVEAPETPERAGYRFVGWYEKDATDAYVFTEEVEDDLELYAKWVKTYKVTFHRDEGTFTNPSQKDNMTVDADSVLAEPEITKTGPHGFSEHQYELLGWYTDDDFKTEYVFGTPVTKDVDLYAKWVRLHDVRFYENKRSETPLKTILVPEGATVASALTTEADKPYLRAEWDYDTIRFGPNGEDTNLKDLVIGEYCYNLYGTPIYEITFDGNDATSGSMNPMPVEHGDSADLPANTFKKTGYTFNGWKDAAGKDYADKANIKVTADTTLTAQWAPINYTVEFDANGGTGTMDDQSFTYGVAQNLNANAFTKTGHKFNGWKDAAGNTYANEASVSNLATKADATVTLTAQWTPINYTVKFVGGEGAENTMEAQPFTYGTAQNLTANAFTKTGYKFTGWKDANEATYTDKQNVNNLADTDGAEVTLTAQWELINYTVKFVGGEGAEGTMADMPFTYGETKALTANAFTKVGYTFGGWSNGDATYTDSQAVSNLATTEGAVVTLTAKWNPITYKVIFDPNGGELRTKSAGYVVQDFTYDAEQALQENAYVLSGHTFKGWNTRKEGTGTSYADKANVKNLASTEGAEVTLYAQWEKNAPVVNPVTKYKVTYDANGGRGTMGADTVEAGGEYTLLANKFTAPSGKVFKCWKINNKEYKPGEVITVDFDITVKAVWKDKSADLDYVPATGDNFSGFLWALLMLSGAVALVEVAVLRRKRR